MNSSSPTTLREIKPEGKGVLCFWLELGVSLIWAYFVELQPPYCGSENVKIEMTLFSAYIKPPMTKKRSTISLGNWMEAIQAKRTVGCTL